MDWWKILENLWQNMGCVRKEKGGFMNGKTLYIPNEADVDHIVQNIRAELLRGGEISENIVVLTALLNKSQDLQRYFLLMKSRL